MEIHEKYGSLARSVAGDPELRARIWAEPARVLEEHGISAPSGTEVRVVEDSAAVKHVILPPDPNAALSDSGLEETAGGSTAPRGPYLLFAPSCQDLDPTFRPGGG